MIMISKRGETAEIQRLDQIPQGMTEEEVDAFWLSHSLGDGLLEQMEPFPEDFPLPPRGKPEEVAGTEPDHAKRAPSPGQIMLGVATPGLLAAGLYIAFRLVKGNANASAFVPTRVPYLRASRLIRGAISVAGSTAKAIGAR